MFTLSKENRINTIIPDQNSFSDTIYIQRAGKIHSLKISVAISHPYIGDISIKLLSPSGTEVILRDQQGGRDNNLDIVFQGGALDILKGEATNGPWILTVQDHAAHDDGTLDSWSIDLSGEEESDYTTEIFIPNVISKEVFTSKQECRFNGRVTKAEAQVDLVHPAIKDLIISIVAPSGKEVILHNREASDKPHLHKRWSNYSLKAFVGETTLGDWILKIKNFNLSNAGTLEHWKIRFHFEREDDLTLLKGISPKVETLLKDAGIFAYMDLATASTDSIKKILLAEDPAYGVYDPSTWSKQAILAAQGQWEKLKNLKDSIS